MIARFLSLFRIARPETRLERAFGKQLIAHDLAAAAKHLDRIRGGRA